MFKKILILLFAFLMGLQGISAAYYYTNYYDRTPHYNDYQYGYYGGGYYNYYPRSSTYTSSRTSTTSNYGYGNTVRTYNYDSSYSSNYGRNYDTHVERTMVREALPYGRYRTYRSDYDYRNYQYNTRNYYRDVYTPGYFWY